MFSSEEKKRRTEAARMLLQTEKLDALLTIGNGCVGTNAYGCFRYLTAANVYYGLQAALFFAEGGPVGITDSEISSGEMQRAGIVTDCRINTAPAGEIVTVLRERNIINGRVGTCLDMLPQSWRAILKRELPELELCDVSEPLFRIRNHHMAIVAVLACAFFGALSGSAPATVAAIGGIMIPAMMEKNYDTPWTTCLLASSGSLGAIIPPSIPMVLYGVLAKTSVSALFCGGIVPGLLIALGYCLYARGFSKKFKMVTSPKPSGKELWKAFVDAIWALLMPVIILGGIYGGYFTPTEAAAVAVVYGLLVGLFVYRELKWKEIPKTFVNAARTSAAVMMIIVTAATFAIVLTRNNIPTLIGNWIISIAKTPLMFYGLFSIFMFFLGMFMSVSPALVILTPILAPAATAIGIDPVHFGVVFVVWMCIGTITPPFGSDLFIACGVAKISAASAFKRVWPFVIIYTAVVVLIMVFPDLVTFLPKLLHLM